MKIFMALTLKNYSAIQLKCKRMNVKTCNKKNFPSLHDENKKILLFNNSHTSVTGAMAVVVG